MGYIQCYNQKIDVTNQLENDHSIGHYPRVN